MPMKLNGLNISDAEYYEKAAKIKQEMERETKSDLILEMLDILFHILQIEEDTDSYSEIMTYIERAVKTMIVSGDYNHAIASLNRIKGIYENEKEISPKHAETAIGVIDALGDDEFLQAVEPHVVVSSFNPEHDNYDAGHHASFAFAKRLVE